MEEQFIKVMDLLADKIVERMSGKFGQLQSKVDEQGGERVLYTIKQVCEMLHISKSKLYRHQKRAISVRVSMLGALLCTTSK